MLIAPYNDLDTTMQLVEPVADRLAAIIVEPVQRSLMPKAGFLTGLRALCDRIGALLVFDEVVTGFRLALGGAQEAFGVKPDLCSLGKVIGGGLPRQPWRAGAMCSSSRCRPVPMTDVRSI